MKTILDVPAWPLASGWAPSLYLGSIQSTQIMGSETRGSMTPGVQTPFPVHVTVPPSVNRAFRAAWATFAIALFVSSEGALSHFLKLPGSRLPAGPCPQTQRSHWIRTLGFRAGRARWGCRGCPACSWSSSPQAGGRSPLRSCNQRSRMCTPWKSQIVVGQQEG